MIIDPSDVGAPIQAKREIPALQRLVVAGRDDQLEREAADLKRRFAT